MKDLPGSNNQIIRRWTAPFLEAVHAAQKALGIKHNRTEEQKAPKAKFRQAQGEITAISVGLTKGLIMTHKGKGAYPENRKEKPFFNPIAEKEVAELADQLAVNTGDTICGNLIIR